MKVGICLITKNCYGPYLTDWLQYHTDLGVDVFYIYDNISNPSVQDTIGSQIKDFNVMLSTIEGECAQLTAYNHCIKNIKDNKLIRCDRLAFIDDDEYIACENNDIKKTLEKYNEHSGLGINWLMYGSSGIKNRNSISQRKKFTHHSITNIEPKNFFWNLSWRFNIFEFKII